MIIRLITFILAFLNLIVFINCGDVLRPRGVPLTKKLFYEPSKDFTCIDGSGTIPFIYVNDDYCDCDDGSDEPGTSACPNGVFHCSNKGFEEATIPTSRINDGICDCCDGSDEYNSTMKCEDICWVLGQAAREARERLHRLIEEGSVIREQYKENAKLILAENEKKLSEYKNELESLKSIRDEKEALKKTAEEKERAALSAHQEKVNELKRAKEQEDERKQQEREEKLAEVAFNELDLDKNEILTYSELQKFIKFDQNADGQVSDDEAKFFLHMKDAMDLDEFKSTGWIIMKPYYMKDKQEPLTESSEQTDTEHVDSEHAEVPTEESISPDHEDHEEEEEVDEEATKDVEKKHTEVVPVEEIKLPYDEETQAILDLAKKAKEEFDEVDGKYLEIERNIRDAEVTLETDYGPENEFLPLQGQCFEMSDRQYTYKLCLFDRASQSSTDGSGGEVNLGRWGKWAGPENNKYELMRYEGGTTCWNGPARSVVVRLTCGTENRITSATEPSRCEYAFDFETPALCVKSVDSTMGRKHEHNEL